MYLCSSALCLIVAHLHLRSDVSTWIKAPDPGCGAELQPDHAVVSGSLTAVPSIAAGPPEWSCLIKMQISFLFETNDEISSGLSVCWKVTFSGGNKAPISDCLPVVILCQTSYRYNPTLSNVSFFILFFLHFFSQFTSLRFEFCELNSGCE